MSRLSTRQRILIGGLIVAAVIGVADWLSGNGGPAALQAGQKPAAAPAPVIDVQDTARLVSQLTNVEYASVQEDLEGLGRDIFFPTALIDDAFREVEAAQPGQLDGSAEVAVAAADFRSAHRLVGVMLGGAPLAVIDDLLLPLDGRLEGHKLVEIQRDYVVFEEPGTNERITLALEQPAQSP